MSLQEYPLSHADLMTILAMRIIGNTSFEEIAESLQYTHHIKWVDQDTVGFKIKSPPKREVTADKVRKEYETTISRDGELSYNAWANTLQKKHVKFSTDNETQLQRCLLWFALGQMRKDNLDAVELSLEGVDVPFMPFQGQLNMSQNQASTAAEPMGTLVQYPLSREDHYLIVAFTVAEGNIQPIEQILEVLQYTHQIQTVTDSLVAFNQKPVRKVTAHDLDNAIEDIEKKSGNDYTLLRLTRTYLRDGHLTSMDQTFNENDVENWMNCRARGQLWFQLGAWRKDHPDTASHTLTMEGRPYNYHTGNTPMR
ncbi:MAG: hypothetical protein Q9218_002767 [Villophora microphyllina]